MSTFKERASQPASSKQSGMRSPSLRACLERRGTVGRKKSSPDGGTAPTVEGKDHHWFGQASAGAALSYTGNNCKGKMPSLMQSRTGWHRYPEKQL
eukprot:COSAG01_NODE_3030_length_6698_cov_13.145022_1_plen_95_part_10